jgi:hypothetical protein
MRFAADLRAFADRTKARNHAVVRDCLIVLATKVITRSPVDTGRFRGSWRYSPGSPAVGVPKTLDKSGSSTIALFRAAVPEQPAGLVHYITNNQPYGVRLEFGWSKQAPNGMVGISVKEWSQIVTAAAKGLE